eukprot:TRINITY_DN7494_c0_g1_i1.p1 TRINITY_DN7494_c0_g1~~TRINITY_DN7494_c0_g1_i1.p1  ORF type:complete len:1254 (+),score=200.60 TRINITY_DN7494_c0_g1_i1:53-3814(+)
MGGFRVKLEHARRGVVTILERAHTSRETIGAVRQILDALTDAYAVEARMRAAQEERDQARPAVFVREIVHDLVNQAVDVLLPKRRLAETGLKAIALMEEKEKLEKEVLKRDTLVDALKGQLQRRDKAAGACRRSLLKEIIALREQLWRKQVRGENLGANELQAFLVLDSFLSGEGETENAELLAAVQFDFERYVIDAGIRISNAVSLPKGKSQTATEKATTVPNPQAAWDAMMHATRLEGLLLTLATEVSAGFGMTHDWLAELKLHCEQQLTAFRSTLQYMIDSFMQISGHIAFLRSFLLDFVRSTRSLCAVAMSTGGPDRLRYRDPYYAAILGSPMASPAEKTSRQFWDSEIQEFIRFYLYLKGIFVFSNTSGDGESSGGLRSPPSMRRVSADMHRSSLDLSGASVVSLVPFNDGTRPAKPFLDWSVADVGLWLGDLGLSQFQWRFRSANIDGRSLATMDQKTLLQHLWGDQQACTTVLAEMAKMRRPSSSNLQQQPQPQTPQPGASPAAKKPKQPAHTNRRKPGDKRHILKPPLAPPMSQNQFSVVIEEGPDGTSTLQFQWDTTLCQAHLPWAVATPELLRLEVENNFVGGPGAVDYVPQRQVGKTMRPMKDDEEITEKEVLRMAAHFAWRHVFSPDSIAAVRRVLNLPAESEDGDGALPRFALSHLAAMWETTAKEAKRRWDEAEHFGAPTLAEIREFLEQIEAPAPPTEEADLLAYPVNMFRTYSTQLAAAGRDDVLLSASGTPASTAPSASWEPSLAGSSNSAQPTSQRPPDHNSPFVPSPGSGKSTAFPELPVISSRASSVSVANTSPSSTPAQQLVSPRRWTQGPLINQHRPSTAPTQPALLITAPSGLGPLGADGSAVMSAVQTVAPELFAAGPPVLDTLVRRIFALLDVSSKHEVASADACAGGKIVCSVVLPQSAVAALFSRRDLPQPQASVSLPDFQRFIAALLALLPADPFVPQLEASSVPSAIPKGTHNPPLVVVPTPRVVPYPSADQGLRNVTPIKPPVTTPPVGALSPQSWRDTPPADPQTRPPLPPLGALQESLPATPAQPTPGPEIEDRARPSTQGTTGLSLFGSPDGPRPASGPMTARPRTVNGPAMFHAVPNTQRGLPPSPPRASVVNGRVVPDCTEFRRPRFAANAPPPPGVRETGNASWQQYEYRAGKPVEWKEEQQRKSNEWRAHGRLRLGAAAPRPSTSGTTSSATGYSEGMQTTVVPAISNVVPDAEDLPLPITVTSYVPMPTPTSAVP